MLDPGPLTELLGIAAPAVGDLDAFIEALSARHPPTIRLKSSIEPQQLPFSTEPVPWYSFGYRTNADEKPSRWLNHVAADYYIQDAGSMLSLALCEDIAGLRVCDLCAAPGGKSTAIVEQIGDGWLLANEPVAGRTAALEFNLSRTGSSRWAVSSLDPDRLADQLPGEFDLVLVDAPCSGQTLVGRGKQREAAWSEKQIAHSAARQKRILAAASRLLRPGGRLIYSTCTFAAAENEEQIDWLTREFRFAPQAVSLQSSALLETYRSPSHEACYRLWPHRDQCAGAFAAALRCNEDETNISNTNRFVSQSLPAINNMLPELKSWGELQNVRLHQLGRRIVGWPDSCPVRWLPVISSGPELAYQTGKTWHPGYPLALRNDSHWQPHQTVQLSFEQTKAFLGGQALMQTDTDWQVICWENRPICWGKGDGRRIRPALPPALHQLYQLSARLMSR